MAQRTFAGSDAVQSSTFSVIHDASFSDDGRQGAAPPLPVRRLIREKYFEKPDGEALYPWLKNFFPIPYIMGSGCVLAFSTPLSCTDLRSGLKKKEARLSWTSRG